MTEAACAEAAVAVGFDDNPLRRSRKMLAALDELLPKFREVDQGLKALKKALGNGELVWTPPCKRTK